MEIPTASETVGAAGAGKTSDGLSPTMIRPIVRSILVLLLTAPGVTPMDLKDAIGSVVAVCVVSWLHAAGSNPTGFT